MIASETRILSNQPIVANAEVPEDAEAAATVAGSNWLKDALDRGVSYQSMVSMFLAMCADWSEQRLVSAMDKAAKDMETYNEYEAWKGKLDILASELATKDKDATIAVPADLAAWLKTQNFKLNGLPLTDKSLEFLTVGQVKSLIVDTQKAGAAFGDRNTANNLEVQQAMTALNATREDQKGFIKKMTDLRESISRATYG